MKLVLHLTVAAEGVQVDALVEPVVDDRLVCRHAIDPSGLLTQVIVKRRLGHVRSHWQGRLGTIEAEREIDAGVIVSPLSLARHLEIDVVGIDPVFQLTSRQSELQRVVCKVNLYAILVVAKVNIVHIPLPGVLGEESILRMKQLDRFIGDPRNAQQPPILKRLAT